MPPKAPPPEQQARIVRTIARLYRLEKAGRCEVLFGDESGFCLQPSLPYLWQKKGKGHKGTVGLPSQAHSKRLNVLGMLRQDGSVLHHFCTQEKITAQFVIDSIELLMEKVTPTQPTVLILDNAGVHRAKIVQQKRAEWKKRGLRLLFLPPYCPHLNRIETLWRMVKHRWLPIDAYQNFEKLCQAVEKVLDQVGHKYRITFA